MASPRSPARSSFTPEGLGRLLASSSSAERGAALSSLEGYVARLRADGAGPTPLAEGVIAPLAAVLSKPATEVGVAEFRRCVLVASRLLALGGVAIGCEWLRDRICWLCLGAEANALDIAARVPIEELTKDHALLLAAAQGCFAPIFVRGMDSVSRAAGVAAADVLRDAVSRFAQSPDAWHNAVSTLLLGALREDRAQLEESVVAGSWALLGALAHARPDVALHQVQGGAAELALRELRTASSSSWVSIQRDRAGKFGSVFTALSAMAQIPMEHKHLLAATKDLLEASLDAYRAYEATFRAADANVVLMTAASALLRDSRLHTASEANADAVKCAASSLRFAIEHPLVLVEFHNLGTAADTIETAAELFGREEAAADWTERTSSVQFRQRDVDGLISRRFSELNGTAAHGMGAHLQSFWSLPVLALCVSDTNKSLLIKCKDLVPMLLSGLFLEADHPRGLKAVPPAAPTHEYVQLVFQRNFTEALQQLALWEPAGRVLLLQTSAVMSALETVAARGMTEEARVAATGTLTALRGGDGRAPAYGSGSGSGYSAPLSSHIYISYQHDDQNVISRLHQSLVSRGYSVWLDLDDLRRRIPAGSSGGGGGYQTAETTWDAVADAGVVLLGCSAMFKESAQVTRPY